MVLVSVLREKASCRLREEACMSGRKLGSGLKEEACLH